MAEQAGLSDVLTMRDRAEQRYFAGLRDAAASQPSPAATMADPEPPPAETFGVGGLAEYGLRSGLRSALVGTGRAAADWFGATGVEETLGEAAAAVGPSEAQSDAAQRYMLGPDGDPSLLKKVGDAVVMEAPMLLSTIGGAAAVGAVRGGRAGLLTGALAGAWQGFSRMYDQGAASIDEYRRREIAAERGVSEAEVPDEEVRARYTDDDRFNVTASALSSSVLEAAPIARIISKLPLGDQLVKRASEQALRVNSPLAAAGREAALVGAMSGGQEVAQELIAAALTDYALRDEIAQLPEQDILSIGEFIAEERGEDLAVSFLAGFGLGGAVGAPGGALQQNAANKVAAERVKTLVGVAEQRGVGLAALEETAKGPRAAALAEAAKRVEQHQLYLRNAEQALANAQAGEAPPEQVRTLSILVEKRKEELDEIADEVGAALQIPGWMRRDEVAQKKALEDQTRRGAAIERLRGLGMADGDPVVETSVVEAEAKKVAEAAARRADLETRAEAVANPTRKAEIEERLTQARIDEAEARVTATMALYGVDRVTAQADADARARRVRQAEAREAAIAKQTALEFPETMAPEERLARARAIIAEAEANPAADEKGLRRKIERLANARRAETDPAKIDRITDEIADLEARVGLPAPAVEAARRVAQALGERSQAEGEAPRPEPSPQPAAAPAAAGLADAPASTPEDAARFADDTDEELLAEFGAEAGRPGPAPAETAAPSRKGGSPNLNRELAGLPPRQRVAFADRARAARDGDDAARAAFADEAKRRGLISDAKAAPALLERVVAADDADRAEAETLLREIEGLAEDDPRRAGWDVTDDAAWEPLLEVTGLAPDLDTLEARLRDWTELSGREASAFVAADGTLLGAGTNRLVNGVMPPRNGWGDPTVTFTHTHTVESPFSAADVRLMMQHGGPFRAILPSGAAIQMRPLRRVSRARLNELWRALVAEADKRLPKDLDPLDRARIRQEAFLQRLEADGLIEVSIPFEGLTLPQREMVDDLFDATEEAAARLVAGGDDGPGAQETGRGGRRAGRDRAREPEAPQGPETRVGRKQRLSANPERVKELANLVYDEIAGNTARPGKLTRWGRPSSLIRAVKTFNVPRENFEKAMAVAARSIGSKRGYVVRDIVEALFPGVIADPASYERGAGAKFTRTGAGTLLKIRDEHSEKVGAAISLLTAVSRVDKGFFYPEMGFVKRNFDNRRFLAAHHMASSQLMRFLDFQGTAEARLAPPLDDPDDVSRVVKKRSSEMTREQLEPAMRTARRFQRHRYTIDRDRLAALVPEDLLSKKGLAAQGLSKEMIPRTRQIEAQMRASGLKGARAHAALSPEDRQFMSAFGYALLTQLDLAERKLDRFRRAVDEFEKTYPGEPVGFLYQVDDKGRIYADGELHPQSSEAVRSIFRVDDVSLADMVELDASASGWQIAALMARDEAFAPRVNLGRDQGRTPGFQKQDIYLDTIAALERRVRAKAAAGDPQAEIALRQVVEPGVLKRDMMKTPIIAVNYAATVRNFQNHMKKALPASVPAKTAGWLGSEARAALEEIAPRTMRMQNWALDTIEKTIAAVESDRSVEEAETRWTVGLDATFKSKRMKTREALLRARTSVDVLEFEKDPTDPNGLRYLRDANGDPVVKGIKRGGEAGQSERVMVRLDQLDPAATARSIYSQIIQGFDASILHRAVERYGMATGDAFVTTNHDAFTVPRGREAEMAAALRESMKEIMERAGDVPQRIYDEAVENLRRVGKTPEEVGIRPPPPRGSYDLADLDTAAPAFFDTADAKDVVPGFTTLGEYGRDLARALEPEGPAQAVDVANYMEQLPQAASTLRQVQDAILDPAIARRSFWESIEDNFFNAFAPIRRLEIDVKGELPPGMDSAFKAAEIAVNDSGRNEALLYYGAAMFDQNGAFAVKPGTMGLKDIFRLAGGEGPDRGQRLQHWMEFMVARRAEQLHARGIKTPLTDQDIQTALARRTPEFEQAAAAWKAFNDANLDFLEASGRISKAQKDAMQADDFYVPFYRTDQRLDGTSPELIMPPYEGGGRSGGVLARDPGIMKIKGGDKQRIANLATNMIRNSQALVAAAMRNTAANKTFDLLEQVGWAEIKPLTSAKPDPNAVRIWRNGVESWAVPKAPEAAPFVLALAGLQPLQLGRIQQFLADIASLFRQSITLTPPFLIRNWIRGVTSTALLTSGSNLTRVGNPLSGFAEVYTNSQAAQAFKAKSGMGDYRFGAADVGIGKDDLLVEFGVAPKTLGYRARRLIDAMERVGTATELGDRVAAFKSLQANGVRPDEAAYQALTIMNYNRRGASQELRALLPLVPFLNARLQGYSRLAEGAVTRKGSLRNRREAMMRLALTGSVYMLLAAGVWAWNASDEERRTLYTNEPLHRRLNYHIVYVDGKAWYIPKPFELGHAFSSIPELLLDHAMGDLKEVPAGVAKIFVDTIAMSAIPQAIKPIVDLAANYDSFRQAAIESLRERDLVPERRVANASVLAQFLGDDLGVTRFTQMIGNMLGLDADGMSPSEIEYALQSYGGIAYGIASTIFDVVGADLDLIGLEPLAAKQVTSPFGDVPVLSPALSRAFGWAVKDTDLAKTKLIEDYYRLTDYITQITRTARQEAKFGDRDYAAELLARAPNALAAQGVVNKARVEMGKLQTEMRAIRGDRTLSRAEKERRLEPLQKAQNELARQVTRVIRELEKRQGGTFQAAR